jgi:hypothetical protein
VEAGQALRFIADIQVEVSGEDADEAMNAVYWRTKRMKPLHIRHIYLKLRGRHVLSWSPRRRRFKKTPSEESVERLAIELLQAGMPFDLVADVVRKETVHV